MAQYDGSIRINTQINTSNLNSQVMRINETLRRLEGEATRLRSRLRELETTQIPTEEYTNLSNQLGRAQNRLDQFIQRQQRMQAEGRNNGAAWERLNRQIEVARGEVSAVETQMQELVNTGRAFRLGSDTDEYQRTAEQLRRVEADIDINNRRLQEMRNRQDDASDGFEEMEESADEALRNINSGLQRASRSIKSLLGALGLSLGIAGLVAFGKQAIDTASDIQEVQNVVDTAFGGMSYKMEQFAKTSVKQFGISQLSAKQLGSTFMAMGKSMGGDMETASNMALNLTARAADMASFYNKSVQETSTALKSIYTGETESLKEYGVVMTQINLQEFARQQGINKSIQAMTQAQKVELQYAYVMQQTALAAGDFAKTSDSWANQTRILSEQFKELLSILGSGLITVLTPVVKFLNTVLTQLIAIAKQIGAILSKLFGISIPVADSGKFAQDMADAAGGADDLADGIEAAGKAAKKSLSPLDRLNVLSRNTGEKGSDSGGGFEMPDLEMDETQVEEVDAMSSAIDNLLDRLKPLFDWFKKLKDLFVKGFFDGLGESWKERIDEIADDARNIVKTLTEIFTDPGVVASARTMIEKIAYALGQVVGSIASIGITLAQNIVGGIDMYLEQNKEFLKQKLISIFDITGDIALLIGEAFESIAYIFEAFGSENGQQLTANIIGIFVNTFMSLLEIGLKFGRDLLDCIITPISENKEGLRTALEGLLGVAVKVSGTVLDAINHTFEKINEVYDKYFKPFFESIKTGLSELLAKFLEFWNGYMQPILDKWAEMFDTLMKEHIQPMIDNFLDLVGKIVEALTMMWESTIKPIIAWLIEVIAPTMADIYDIVAGVIDQIVTFIADAINGIVEIVEGVIDILIGIAQGDWQRVWDGFAEVIDGVVGIIKGFVNNFIGIIENMANAAVAAINLMIRAINTIKFTVPDWIPGVGGNSVGFNIPEINKISIPRLATGAVIPANKEFLAVLGDQKHGTNIEAPLATIEEAVINAIAKINASSSNNSSGNITLEIPVVINGIGEIGRAVQQFDREFFKQSGRHAFT